MGAPEQAGAPEPHLLKEYPMRRERTTPDLDNTVRVFTYGTLRPGHYNARLFQGAVLRAEDATAKGHKLYANQGGSYPYLVADDDPESTVKGTLYLLDTEGPQFIRAHHMELGAGYDWKIINVETEHGPATAVVWDWRRPEYLGDLIPSGDWEVYEREGRRPRFLPTTRGI